MLKSSYFIFPLLFFFLTSPNSALIPPTYTFCGVLCKYYVKTILKLLIPCVVNDWAVPESQVMWLRYSGRVIAVTTAGGTMSIILRVTFSSKVCVIKKIKDMNQLWYSHNTVVPWFENNIVLYISYISPVLWELI